MRVIVTGCAGFIGSHLCERLISMGYEIVGVDSFTDYYERHLKERNLATLLKSNLFRLIAKDVADPEVLHEVSSSRIVFHLAAQPGVRSSWGRQFEVYIRNNVLATQILLEAARKASGLERFVYASSSSVYGQTTSEKVSEEDLTRPYSPYGVSKLAGEHLCSLYGTNFGLPVISLRFFTVYGPRQRPDMAFHKLIKATLTGTCFPLYGDGRQERDFTFVEDVVEGLVKAATVKDVKGVFNIGGGHVVSLCHVIDEVQAVTGKRVNIEKFPRVEGDVMRTSADISVIRSALGYVPKTNLREGLSAEVEWMKTLLKS